MAPPSIRWSAPVMFAARGEVAMTHLVFPTSRWNRIEITGEGALKIPARIAVTGR